MAKFYRRWMKIGGGVGAGVVSIMGLFMLLSSHFGFDITGEDDNCAGTLDDPCMSRVWIENPTRYNVDIYNPDIIELEFSPQIPDHKLFAKDGRCSGKDGSACCSPDGVCLKGWRFTDFTEATKSRSDTSYVYRFPAYTTKEFLVWGLKENPTDRVKWGLDFDGPYLANGYMDPIWSYGASGSGNLVAHFNMNGNALDSSGYGNDGTVNGASIVPGRFALGYSFDGIDDYINNSIDYSTGKTELTTSCWAKAGVMADDGAPSFRHVCGNFKGSTSRGGITFVETTHQMRCTNYNDTITTSVAFVIFNDTIDHSWNHWGCSIDINDDGKSKIYKNGVLVGTSATVLTGTLAGENSSFYIGGDSAGRYWNGTIDEVRVYNVSLTAAEVRELYNETKVSNSHRLFGAQEEAQLASDNLVSHWKFNSDALDSSGNGNDGTVTGASIVPGKFGLGYDYDGTNDFVSMGASLDANYSGAFAVSAWINPTDVSSTIAVIGGSPSLYFDILSTQIRVFNGDLSDTNLAGSTILENVWTHVVFTYNGTQKTIYVNGASDATEGATGNLIIANTEIGRATVAVGRYWDGAIDEVRIYNSSLTAAQVRQLYNETKTSHATRLFGASEEAQPADTLNGHWKMNGNALDSSVQGNDGTVTGASVLPGKFGLAYDFDGTNDNIVVGGTPLQNDSGSVSVWVKPGAQSATNFVVYGVGGGTNRFYLRLSAADSIQFIRGDLTPAVIYTIPVSNVYYHFVGTWDDSNNISLYVNGVLRDSDTWTGGGDDAGFNIGMANSAQYFNGAIDELRIYNTSLSPAQVRQLYNETKTSHSKKIYGNPEMT